MTRYSGLLKRAVDSIVSTFKKRVLTSLLSSRGGLLADTSKQVSETTDFELITWLVIKQK